MALTAQERQQSTQSTLQVLYRDLEAQHHGALIESSAACKDEAATRIHKGLRLFLHETLYIIYYIYNYIYMYK